MNMLCRFDESLECHNILLVREMRRMTARTGGVPPLEISAPPANQYGWPFVCTALVVVADG